MNAEVTVMDEFVTQLWRKFHEALLNYIKKNISNPEDAEDILQNVFLKIHTNIHQLKEKEKVSSWLYRVTRNTIIDTYRVNGNKKAELLTHLDDKIGMEDDSLEKSWELEISSCVKRMIRQLPEKYRTVLAWYEFDGLTHKQIAQRLGISVSGSKTRVQRSREKMKELFICGCNTEGEFKKGKSADSPAACTYLVKTGRTDICVQKLEDAQTPGG